MPKRGAWHLGPLAARGDNARKRAIREDKHYAAIRAVESEADKLYKQLEERYPPLAQLRDYLFWEVRLKPTSYQSEQLLRGIRLLLAGEWKAGKTVIDYAIGTVLPEEPPDKPIGRPYREQVSVPYKGHDRLDNPLRDRRPFDVEKDPLALIGKAYQPPTLED